MHLVTGHVESILVFSRSRLSRNASIVISSRRFARLSKTAIERVENISLQLALSRVETLSTDGADSPGRPVAAGAP
jgi:hypothetical protein